MTNETKTQEEAILTSFIAYDVVEKGDKSYWNQIGSCFAHKDGKGHTLRLHSLPINFSGTVTLREPKAD